MKKNFTEIEIPFGVKDSELYQFTYTIPDGYSAEIKDGMVIVKKKESEDERIRKELIEEIEFIIPHDDETDSEGLILPSYHARIDRYKSYLEKQKEAQPGDEDRYMEGYMNGMNDAMKEQKPAEWSKEDEAILSEIISFFRDGTIKLQHDLTLYANWLEDRIKSLRSQPHWKPSEEQMDHLAYAYTQLKLQKCYAPHVYESLGSLYDDLKKLI